VLLVVGVQVLRPGATDRKPDHLRPALGRRNLNDLRLELDALGQGQPSQKFEPSPQQLGGDVVAAGDAPRAMPADVARRAFTRRRPRAGLSAESSAEGQPAAMDSL
jgi:hypothetical protein